MSEFNLRWLCWLGLHKWLTNRSYVEASTLITVQQLDKCKRCGVLRI